MQTRLYPKLWIELLRADKSSGTPLKNNLDDYYCIGSLFNITCLEQQTLEFEFTNRFVTPVNKGELGPRIEKLAPGK